MENGFVPYASIHEDEILANALANMAPQGRPAGPSETIPRSLMSFTYALGGPTTHFAGSGADPWSEAGYGNKRTKLKNLGVTEEDWMYRTAADCRAIDETLREMRAERLGTLSGRDMDGWVWNVQKVTADGAKEEGVKREVAEWLRPERKRSGLSQEVIPIAEGDEIPVETGVEMNGQVEDGVEGGIVVETRAEEVAHRAKYNWGLGSWQPGVVRAVIEVS